MKNMKGASVMSAMKKYLSLLLILVLVLTHAPLSALAESGLGEDGQLETEEELEQVLEDEEDEDIVLSEEDLEVKATDPEEDDIEIIYPDELLVGHPTVLKGDFFTEMIGNDTADIDVRALIHGYNLVNWDQSQGVYVIDPSVVQNVKVMDDKDGNRTYFLALWDDLQYSDGTPITAWDYAFSLLLMMSPEIEEIGGKIYRAEHILGYDEYITKKADTLGGVSVLSDHQIAITLDHEFLPYFFEIGLLLCVPYPIYKIAPGCKVYDDGYGVYIGNEDKSIEEPIYTAELLKETILDPETGYNSHPSVVSGPYVLLDYDGITAHFEINPYFKGAWVNNSLPEDFSFDMDHFEGVGSGTASHNGPNYIRVDRVDEEGNEDPFYLVKPTIKHISFTVADNDTMAEDLVSGKFNLVNKVVYGPTILECLGAAGTDASAALSVLTLPGDTDEEPEASDVTDEDAEEEPPQDEEPAAETEEEDKDKEESEGEPEPEEEPEISAEEEPEEENGEDEAEDEAEGDDEGDEDEEREVRYATATEYGINNTPYPRIGLAFLTFSYDWPTVHEMEVRQAIAWCMDRDQLTYDYCQDFGIRVDGYYGIEQWEYLLITGQLDYPIDNDPENPLSEEEMEEEIAKWEALSLDNLVQYHVDLDKANELLDQAGWTLNRDGEKYRKGVDDVRCKMVDGELVALDLSMMYPEGNHIVDTLQENFIDNLNKCGILLTLVPTDMQELFYSYYRETERTTDMIYLATNFHVVVDPSITYSCDPTADHLIWNNTYSDDEELWLDAVDMRKTEPGAVYEYVTKWITFQERYNKVLPCIPIYSNIYFDFYTGMLQNYHITAHVTWTQAILEAYFGEPEEPGEGELDDGEIILDGDGFDVDDGELIIDD
ncbi:MAG: hypothetical protein IKH30_09595 [Clostridia bacterium]|nr:hypothetical protein [Clostridia bacterium]